GLGRCASLDEEHAPRTTMTWLLVLTASFVFLGTRRRPRRVSVYLTAFIVIVFGVAYETLKLHLL
ncbi:MAG: hypothetical protein QOD49_3008, partial [Actinomycetota bacterium]|nr:hypothetical protein [Actinomycetota bacterium]